MKVNLRLSKILSKGTSTGTVVPLNVMSPSRRVVHTYIEVLTRQPESVVTVIWGWSSAGTVVPAVAVSAPSMAAVAR